MGAVSHATGHRVAQIGRKRAAHSRSRLQIPSPGKAEDLRFPIDRTACPRQMPPSRNETGPRLAGM